MKEIKNLLNNKKEINGFEVKKNNDNYFTLSKENEEMADIFIYNNFILFSYLISLNNNVKTLRYSF